MRKSRMRDFFQTISKHFGTLRRNPTAKDSGIYLLTGGMSKAIPFLMLPVLTRFLTPKDYGYVATFTLVTSFSMILSQVATHGSVQVYYYKIRKDFFPEHVCGALWLISFMSMALLTVLFVFSDWLVQMTLLPFDWLVYAVISAIFDSYSGVLLSLLRIKRRALVYGVYELVRTLSVVSLSLILVIGYKMGWHGRVLATFSTSLVLSLASLFVLFRYGFVRFHFSLKSIGDHLKFGAPLIPHAIGGLGVAFSSRFFLNHYSSINMTGLFSLSYQLGGIVEVFTTSVNTAWLPTLYEQLHNEDDPQKVVLSHYTIAGFFLMFALFWISLIMLLFPLFFPPDYMAALTFVPYIVIGFLFNGFYILVSNFISFSKKTHLLGASTSIVGGVSIVLNFIFIKHWGAMGASYAFILSYLLMFLVTSWLSHHCYPMPWFRSRLSNES